MFADVIQTSIGRQNEDGNSLLSIAAENGLADVVDHILAFNGSVNNVNKANLTAAQLAESNCFLDIAKKINLRVSAGDVKLCFFLRLKMDFFASAPD